MTLLRYARPKQIIVLNGVCVRGTLPTLVDDLGLAKSGPLL